MTTTTAADLYVEHRDTEIHTGDVYVDGCPTCDPEPRCDICDELEDHEPGMIENDWNGETGNHLSCERTRDAHRALTT